MMDVVDFQKFFQSITESSTTFDEPHVSLRCEENNMVMGHTKHFTWDYSERSDILNIHKKGKAVKGAAELGDFTVDFDSEGNILGLEVMHVSDFLKAIGINPEELRDLRGAELLASPVRGNVTYLLLKLLLPSNIEKVIPIPAPVIAA